jgi:GWxTD domain-containing protein
MRRITASVLGALLFTGAGTAATGVAQSELDPESARWLTIVEPLITDEERVAYLALTRRYQRAAFEKRFWEERDPFPETPANEFGDRWRERAPTAIERWDSLSDARALAWAAIGEPAQVLPVVCADRLLPAEIWTYRELGRLRGSFTLVVVSGGLDKSAEHRFWHPREGPLTLAAPGARPQDGNAERFLYEISESCLRGPEIASRLLGASAWETLE